MGQQAATLNTVGLMTSLRQAKARMSMKRSQKINAIAKKKKEIKAHLESGNEGMALIHAETLINDERMVPCLDVLTMMCDHVLERIPLLKKMGRDVPPDMFVTMHTLIYSAERSSIEELITCRKELSKVYGPEFVAVSENDPSSINEVIRDNINLIMPETGRKIAKLVEIARETGIMYQPSESCRAEYDKYMNAKSGIMPNPTTSTIWRPVGPPQLVPVFPSVPGAAPPAQAMPMVPQGPYPAAPYPAAPYPQAGYPPPSAPVPVYPPSAAPPQYPMQAPPPSAAPPQYPMQAPPPPAPPAPRPSYPMAPPPPSADQAPNLIPPPPPAAPGNKSDPDLDDFETRLKNLKKM